MLKQPTKLVKKDYKITSPKVSVSKPGLSSNSKVTRNVQSAAGGSRNPSQNSFKAPNINQSHSATDFVNNAIYEYLSKAQMVRTADSFQDEAGRTTSVSKEIDFGLQSQLLDAFDKGNSDQFFSKWERSVLPRLKGKDIMHESLEFYLHLYFVAYSIHPINPKAGQSVSKEALQKFKVYLETKGSDFAQTTEFIQYYAFPYVPNPKEHLSFKHIFTREWVAELRNKFEYFLNESISHEEVPVIFQMYNAYAKANQQSQNGENEQGGKDKRYEDYSKVIKSLEASNQDLVNILQDYEMKYNQLLREYQVAQKNEEIARTYQFESQTKWMSFLKELVVVSNDLVALIDNQNRGVDVGDDIFETLRRRVQKYESFLNSHYEEVLGQSQDISTFDKISTSQDVGTPDHSSIMHANYRAINRVEEKPQSVLAQNRQEVQSYIALNFEKIKSQLVGPSNNEMMQCNLLQALRWRITRTRGASLRREVIIGYSKHDILDIRRESPCVVESIFKNKSKKVGEYGARFINSLTSDYYGRTYLLESDKLVLLLIEMFIKEKGDSIIRRNCLGALQKLSLRKKPQFIMIEQDIIKWILHALKFEKDSLGEYFYEYATALLMNLSLRTTGKKKCEECEVEILEILNDLLEHENMQVRSFVNGTLYSLLSNHNFREQAHAMGMGEILTYLMQNSDERYKKQIQYIFQRLNSEKVEEEPESQSDTNDEDNDYDDLEDEDEIGDDDEVEDNLDESDGIVGEELLRKYFSLSGPEAYRQNSMINEAIEESRSFIRESTLRDTRQTSEIGTPLHRPTTPGMLTKIIQQQSGMEFSHVQDEFQSKPKIPRTPYHEQYKERILEGHSAQGGFNEQDYFSLSNNNNNQKAGSDNRQSFSGVKINVHPPKKHEEENYGQNKQKASSKQEINNAGDSEFLNAFQSKPRVLRTPPQEKMTKKSHFEDY